VIHRLIGLALGAFMHLLNVERADLACGRHVPASASSHHPTHGAAHHHAPSHGARDSENCQTPAQQDCCQALASCSVVMAAGDAIVPVQPTTSHHGAGAVALMEPHSRVSAPEPPPPKA
jgi:hypothetical protein